eukprot:1168088-Amphidinium_carterae.1
MSPADRGRLEGLAAQLDEIRHTLQRRGLLRSKLATALSQVHLGALKTDMTRKGPLDELTALDAARFTTTALSEVIRR